MRPKDKERLALGAIWLLTVGLILAGRNGRFGDALNGCILTFSAIWTAWLVRSFIPAAEEPEPFSKITATLFIVVIVAMLAGLVVMLSA